jgi:broad specificity phosphatase PhoE
MINNHRIVSVFPRKTEVFLIRHGETEENRSNIIQGQMPGRLSEEGRKQANIIAQTLSDLSIKTIYSSDLLRAADTARVIARALSISTVRYDPRLRERSFGIYEGKPLFSLMRVLVKTGNNLKNFLPKNGEPYEALLKRTRNFLYYVGQHYAGLSVLAVTHYGFIEVAMDICGKEALSGMRINNCDGIILQISHNNISYGGEITHNGVV